MTAISLYFTQTNCKVCRDSSADIATRYTLVGPVDASRWGARFPVTVKTTPAAQPASVEWVGISFQGAKPAGTCP